MIRHRTVAAQAPSQLSFAPPLAGSSIRAVEVRRSDRRRRTVAAKLEDDTLVVYLPSRMSRAEEQHWIEKMRSRFEARQRRDDLNSEGYLESRARTLNAKYFDGKLRWTSIEYVTNQNARYGSCTIDDATIRISDCLAEMPDWVRDYVIVHELAHLIVPDHSGRFWELVARYPLAERARGYLIAKGMES